MNNSCVILPSCTTDLGCANLTGVCGTGKCNMTSGSCYMDYLIGNVCRANASECDEIEYCINGLVDCPNDANKSNGETCNGGICNNGKCEFVCTNDYGCSSFGGFCELNMPYNCTLGADGCLDRTNQTSCDSNQYCRNGICMVGSGNTFYVSTAGNDNNPGTISQPFATLEKARDAIRASGNDGVTVYIKGGTYYLTQPLTFTEQDSGSEGKPNVYTSYPGEKAIISGGKVLDSVNYSWTQYNHNGNIIYKTNVGSLRFNSLFVDDKRATRAREPDVHYHNLSDYYLINAVDNETRLEAFNFSGNDINGSWHNLKDVEVVSFRVWEQSRFKIDRVEGNKVFFQGSLDSWRSYNWPPWGGIANERYYVENVFEGLDEPGEWYLDNETGDLYYWPLNGAPNEHEIIAPVLENLVSLKTENNFLNSSFTISHWVNTNSSASQMYTVGNMGSQGFRFGLSKGRISFLLGNSTSLIESVCGSRYLNDSQWHMISGIFDRENNKFTCYADGKYENQKILPSNYSGLVNILPTIGKPPCCSAYTGIMDELFIFDRALDATEVLDLFNHTYHDPILFLEFDGDTADSSDRMYVYEHGLMDYDSGIVGNGLKFNGSNYLTLKPKEKMENINLENIEFVYTDWNLPSEGYPGGQAGKYLSGLPTIFFQNTKNCSFKNSTIEHTGTYALISISKNLDISGAKISDAGAGGIKIGTEQDSDDDSGNVISDNKIYETGKVFFEGVGLWMLISSNNLISHNQIFNTSYTALSAGWNSPVTNNYCRNNIISYNDIYNFMQEMEDGGGIYTLGNQPGTVIKNNYVHDSDSNYGLYLDDLSGNINILSNLVARVPAALFVKGNSNLIENNIVVDPSWAGLTMRDSSDWEFYRNIFYCNNCTLGWRLIYLVTAISMANESFDYNLYYNSTFLSTSKWNLGWWKSLGYDKHSLEQDPLFVDYANNDFTLQPLSPAFALGFENFDLSNVGPRVECFEDSDCNSGEECVQRECVGKISGTSIQSQETGLNTESVIGTILNWFRGIITGNTIREITGYFLRIKA
jgi:hypothetical protein